MAKKEASKQGESGLTDVRVLCDFWDGERTVKADTVVSLGPASLAAYKEAGYVDDHPDAVAYVKRLKG